MNYQKYTFPSDEAKRKKELFFYSAFFLGIGMVIGGVISVFLFINITGGNSAPSQPIAAPTLSLDDFVTSTNESPTSTPEDEIPTSIPSTETPVLDASISSLAPQLFRIVSAESEAQFSVYETFPEGTAIGRTSEIAGDIIVDFANPSNSQLGNIRINLRTLMTDDPDRDDSIRCCVLLSARPEYEFTEFIPVSISNLPETIEYDQPINFQVIGNMSIRGNVAAVTFDVNLTVLSPNEIYGVATAVVNRSDFGILNDADNGFDYHGVEEQVTLTFDFIAAAVTE